MKTTRHTHKDQWGDGMKPLAGHCKPIYFLYSLLKKNHDISSAALRASATRAIDFKTLPQKVSIPGKNYARYKLLQEKI
jgi:hypothetical protein